MLSDIKSIQELTAMLDTLRDMPIDDQILYIYDMIRNGVAPIEHPGEWHLFRSKAVAQINDETLLSRDQLDAERKIALASAKKAAKIAAQNPEPRADTGRRSIDQYKHLINDVADQAERALAEMPGAPIVFQRSGFLVHILPREPTPKALEYRTVGLPTIKPLSSAGLRLIMDKSADFFLPKNRKLEPDMPQSWLVDSLLEKGNWQSIPTLVGIVSTPTMRSDGTLLFHNGYDASTGLYLENNGMPFPSMHPSPSQEEAISACQELLEPFEDFPFERPCHRSAVLAAILTIIARHAVKNVPLFSISATTAGSGKTLLADCITMIAIGRETPKIPQVFDEDEERKRLLAMALDGSPVMTIDNVSGSFGNSVLDLAITSGMAVGRLLGTNTQKEVPLSTVFLATGNCMTYKGDMHRRVVPISLLPTMEHPETRSDFAHADILSWLTQERHRLVGAALTMLSGYEAAKRPPQPIDNYGSFQPWSDLIRSCLVWCGMADPCEGRAELQASSDDTYEAHKELMHAWWGCYGRGNTRTLGEIVGDLQMRATPSGGTQDENAKSMAAPYDRLREALGAWDDRFDGYKLNSKRVGSNIRKLTGRIIDGMRLKKEIGRSTSGVRWTIEKIEPGVGHGQALEPEELPF